MGGVGFSAKFQSINLTEDCDRTFTSLSGELNFNTEMLHLGKTTKCDYKIVVSLII